MGTQKVREGDETAIRDSREVDQRTPQAVHFQLHQDRSGSNTKVPKTSGWERFTGRHTNTGRQPRGAQALLKTRFPFHHCTP